MQELIHHYAESTSPASAMGSIAVVIPTFNRPGLVLETVQSVLAQTRQAKQIIVVNDGGPEEAISTLIPLAEQGLITLLGKKNGGQASARNLGAAHANADYIIFLDDDDLFLPETLAELASLLDSSQNVASVGFIETFPSQPAKHYGPPEAAGGQYFDLLLDANRFAASAVLMRLKSFREAGGYRETVPGGVEDYDLWLQLAHLGSIARTTRTVLQYRSHGVKVTNRLLQLDGLPKIAQRVNELAGRQAANRVRNYLMQDYLSSVTRSLLRDGLLMADWKMIQTRSRSLWVCLFQPELNWPTTRTWTRIVFGTILRAPVNAGRRLLVGNRSKHRQDEPAI